MTTTSARSVCTRITQRLAESVGARRYSMWFDRTAKFEYDDQSRRLDVAVPNRFVAEWIGRNFGENLRHAARHEVGEGIDLRVRVHPELFETAGTVAAIAAGGVATAGGSGGSVVSEVTSGSPGSVAMGIRPGHRQTHPGPAPAPAPGRGAQSMGQGPLALRHRLEDFIAGPSNELALAAAVRMTEDELTSAHTLFLHGGCGLGKTHLLQGICARVLERDPGARVLYATGEQFTNEFLVAMRSNRIEPFRKRIRALDLLAIDDVHFLANKQATQQEFLHSFDSIELGGARVVLASDSHPRLIRQFSEALISRCIRGMVVEIVEPDTATRAQIVRVLAQRRGIPLLDTVVEVIAKRCVGSVRELEGTLAKLHALASLSQQRRNSAPGNTDNAMGGGPGAQGASMGMTIVEPVGHTLINHLFDSQAREGPRRVVRFEHVQEVITGQLQVTRAQVLSGSRHHSVVLARALIAYLCRQMTTLSFPEIAAALGRKNHSTIITAAQRLQKQLTANLPVILPASMEQVSLGELVERLKRAIARA